MRKIVALVAGVFLAISAQAVIAATAIEYGLIAALIAIAAVDVQTAVGDPSKAFPKEESQRIIHTMETWKKLPPTEENIAFVKKHTEEIKRLVVSVDDPKSHAALRKYMTASNFKPPQPNKNNLKTTASATGSKTSHPAKKTSHKSGSSLASSGSSGTHASLQNGTHTTSSHRH